MLINYLPSTSSLFACNPTHLTTFLELGFYRPFQILLLTHADNISFLRMLNFSRSTARLTQRLPGTREFRYKTSTAKPWLPKINFIDTTRPVAPTSLYSDASPLCPLCLLRPHLAWSSTRSRLACFAMPSSERAQIRSTGDPQITQLRILHARTCALNG